MNWYRHGGKRAFDLLVALLLAWPTLVQMAIVALVVRNSLPKAIITVDRFGRMCDYAAIEKIAYEYALPILEDAAEGLGSWQGERAAGSFGRVGVFSFNGNKIGTTSGGGMLVTDDPAVADKVRFWSQQTCGDLPLDEHNEIGFNDRLSHILAALCRGQLERLQQIIEWRREIYGQYREMLVGISGGEVLGDDPWGRSNMWLATIRFRRPDGAELAVRVHEALEERNIESRRVWKPMHQQPVFSDSERCLSGASDRIFVDGLCLPSGAALTRRDVTRVVQVIDKVVG